MTFSIPHPDPQVTGPLPPSTTPGWPYLRESEMARRARALDWSATPLGPVDRWPLSLRTAIGICLNSRFPMFVWWGPELINIYNDAYIPLMGGKHPGGLGRPARESWSEIWDVVGREAEAVTGEGAATWNERVRLVVDRHGFAEDAWFTWSYSPIPDESGGIGGLFCAVTEDTGRVLAERERDRQTEELRYAECRAERNVADRKRSAEALRESESRFRNMAEHAPVMMWVTEPGGGRVFLNKAWYDFTGQEPHAGEGFGWLDAVHPEDVGPIRDEFAGANAAKRAFRLKFRLRRHDGAYRWAIDAGAPRIGDDGAWLGFIGSVTDVTDLENARRVLEEHNMLLERTVRERTKELEASHRQLRLSERMAALGTLSAGLGHDMGNLLLPVRIRLDSLEAADLPGDLRDDIDAIRTSTEYLCRLSCGLRMLSLNPGRAAPGQATEMLGWWEEAEPVLRNVLPRGIELRSCMPGESCWAGITKPALAQAVFNLVQNAGDALRSAERGVVTVWAECADHELRIGVSDDGPGMTTKVRTRCMEPFFTTKTREISTGMGLALVYGLIQEVGGSVDIRSAPGRGTTFVLHVPVASPDPCGSGRAGEAAVVDVTEPRLRALAAAELRMLGFSTDADARSEDIALAVTDSADAANGFGPGVPVVLFAARAESVGDRVTAIGEQPTPRAIRDAIRRVAGKGRR